MIYVFGDYELDTYYYELRLQGEPLQIEPKVFELLAYFVQHHGKLISKEDLYEHLWPNQYVSESALTYCVASARKAIADNGRAQRLIKTMYGRGYRFLATVEERLHRDPTLPATTPTAQPVDRPALGSQQDEIAAAPLVMSPEPSLSPLPQEPHAPKPSAIDQGAFQGERRQLTVMWCRLVVSPLFSESLDPEELHDLMQDAHAGCTKVIRRFAGHIAHHFGDGFMVYFGYPRAHEDDAQRAVRTALGMVQEMERLNATLGQEEGMRLAVRIGIQTGMVVMQEVRIETQGKPLVLGDAPHIAAQLSGLTELNTVAISPATLRLIEGYFVCQFLGARLLEDLPQPLVVYQVLRESDAQSRLAVAVSIGLTPFIGRREEVGLLRERWEQTAHRLGQVVLLSGEAGIGKSRLVHVLQERMASERYTQIECRCSPYDQNSALYPIIASIQQWLQWSHDDTPEAKLGKLEERLQPYGFALEEWVPLMAALFSLPVPDHYPAVNLTPQRQKQKTLDMLLALFLKETERQPVCLVIEDLHWADASTLELVGLLIDQIHTARLLLLLTFRPDFTPPWAMRSYITHMALNRLVSGQVERMIKRITRDKSLPDDVLQQMVTKSDGIPLFVEEMTKMVLESGLVKEFDGQYELVGTLTPLAIPSTLHDSLMARLDRLGAAKEVAQMGATLGREFSYELIRVTTAMDETTLQHRLSQLVAAELLLQRGSPPQAHYLFKHVLVQETAYESLLRRTRRQYHQQIAQVLEEHFPETGETRPELLAHHYTRAGRQAQAIDYWQQAARQALERSAHADAIAHAQQGLAALDTLPESPEHWRYELALQTMLGTALSFTRGYGAADVVHAYARARKLCEQVGDMPQLVTVLRGLWLFYLARSELPTAYELGEHLLRLARSRNDRALFLEAHRAIATSLFFLGEQAAVLTHLERGLTLYDMPSQNTLSIQDSLDTGERFLHYKALNLWLRGYPEQALETVHQMLRLSQQPADAYSRSHALTLSAVLYIWRRETEAVHERVAAGLALAEEHLFPLPLALGTTFQGWVLAQQGRHDEGLAQMRRGITAYRATGTELFTTCMLALLSEVYRQVGQIEEGLRVLVEALDLADKKGERLWEAELYRLQAEFLLQQATPDVAQAEAVLHQALVVARNQQVKSLELRTTISLCCLWQQQGKHRQAQNILGQLYDWFTEGHNTADLKEAKALLDTLTASVSPR